MTAAPVVLVARPEPEASETCAALEAHGYRALAAPTLIIERVGQATPADLDGADGAIFTSPAAARAAVADLPEGAGRERVAYCVGDKTASLIAPLGFEARSADGDAGDLLALIRDAGARRLVFFRGEDVSRDLASPLAEAGVDLRERVLYRAAQATSAPDAVVAALRDGAVAAALFFSARSFDVFLRLSDGISLKNVCAICLSDRIAAHAPEGAFHAVRVADRPRLDAALTLLLTVSPPGRDR